MTTKEIKINVTLNNENLPIDMMWDASDATGGAMPCKAMQLSVWDPKDNAALRVDLWTKDMYVEEMEHFYFQTLMTMATSFRNATGRTELADIIENAGKAFGKESKILKDQ
jgi:gliding motility-associated protein GldC